MAKLKQVEQVQAPVTLMSLRDGAKLLAAAAVIGIATMAIYALLDKYLFTPALCSGSAALGSCENKSYFASGIALVLGGLGALFFLVQQRVYRPLLVVLLVIVTLWNVPVLLASLPLAAAIFISAIIFALSYGAFAWIVQLKNFVLALIITTILVIVTRFVIMS